MVRTPGSLPRPTLLGQIPQTEPLPGTESRTKPPRTEFFQNADITPPVIPSTVVILSPSCTGLPALPSWCLTSLFSCSCLLVCWPARLPSLLADQPIRSLDCHLPVYMLACHPASRSVICIFASSVVHAHIWHHTYPPSPCQPISSPRVGLAHFGPMGRQLFIVASSMKSLFGGVTPGKNL